MAILPVIILYLEVLLLAFAEKKLWNTWFTPLNCLSVPYAVVLAICLFVDGNMGFVPFFYPSVWVWVVGLAVFFVPSCILGLLQRRRAGKDGEPAKAKEFTVSSFTRRILEYITWGIFALFIFWFIRLAFIKELIPGGENFAHEWAGHGFFGHLFTVLMGLNIFWLFAADKNHKRYWLYVLGFFGVALLYLVKGWFLAPMAAGLLLRLLMGKTRFGIKVILISVFTGFAFFFASYWMTLYVASAEKGVEKQRKEQTEYKVEVSSYIGKHALTYMTAGVYGLSEDLAQDILEYREPAKIYAPFVNICKVLGDKNYVSNLNDQFVQTTTHDLGTNVRTFFGTLYVYLGGGHAFTYVLVFSFLLYGLLTLASQSGRLFFMVLSGWFQSSLLMGWFDITANTLTFFTLPAFLTVIFGACFLWEHRKEIGKKPSGIKWLSLRYIRRLLALLQVIDLSLLLLFFWTPWKLPSYFLGVSVGIAFAFALTVPRRAFNFRFLKPYLGFLLSYLLLAVSITYSSNPAHASSFVLKEISIILIPFVFWGMTPRFFSPKRLRFFAYAFITGCCLLLIVKTVQLVYCFNIFWPYFKVRYVDAGITYMNTGSGFLYSLNEFLSNQAVYFSWAFLNPIMHTTIEALLFNLAFTFVFIARFQKKPLLDSLCKKSLAGFILLMFALALIFSNSKTGQFLFVVNLLLLLIFCFRQKRWLTAGILSSFFLFAGIVGFHYLGMGILGRFTHSVHVVQEIKDHKQTVTNDGSLLPRIYCWKTSIELAKEKPVLGFGASYRQDFNKSFITHYPNYRINYHQTHSRFLSILVSTGLIGLSLLLFGFAQAVCLVWKNRRLWGWIWLLSLFLFYCFDSSTQDFVLFFSCLPYCFLMVEYHNRRDIRKFATDSID